MVSLRASADRKRECSTGEGERSGDDRGLGGERWVRGREREEQHARIVELRKLRRKPPKKRISLSLDADVLTFFKEQDARYYQRLINQTLREVMEEEKRKIG